MSKQFEMEEEQLEKDLAEGNITTAEFNNEMREMQRSYQAEASEAALAAFHDEMDRW